MNNILSAIAIIIFSAAFLFRVIEKKKEEKKPKFMDFAAKFSFDDDLIGTKRYDTDYLSVDISKIVSYNPSSYKDWTTIEMTSGGRYSIDIHFDDLKKIVNNYWK